MRYTVLIALISLLFFGCKKNKFASKPSLTYKTASTSVVGKDQLINLTLNFTDAEGDVDSVYIQKVSLNCSDGNFRDSSHMPMDLPFEKNQQGDIIISFANGINSYPVKTIATSPLCGFNTTNDTCIFRFVIQDKSGNLSDTANSGLITILN